MNKWSKRKSFEGKPRSGLPSVLTNYARNVITKAKYKRNNSTRKIAQKVQHHNINVSSTSVWSLTKKGWKAFKRKKIPLLSEKQRSPRSKFSRKYSKLTAGDWEKFYLQMSVVSIKFITRIQKTSFIIFLYTGIRRAFFQSVKVSPRFAQNENKLVKGDNSRLR